MDIAYMVQTEWSTLLLDTEGVCIQARSRHGQHSKKSASDGAARCIGAQYVASLDKATAGGLIEMPRIGCPMLFAATTPDGRIYLVRTGPVTHFEEVSSGVHDRQALPLQERGTDEVVIRDRPGADQEMTTPFRKHRSQTKQNMRAVGEPEPARADLPAPRRASLPPVQRASLPPPPARRRPSAPPAPSRPLPSLPPHATHATHHPTRRSSAPPPRYPMPEPADTPREVMWSLPEEDLVSDVGSSPVHRARREPAPGHRPSARRRR